MRNVQMGCRLICFLVMLTLIIGWHNFISPFRLSFQQNHINNWSIFLILVGSLFLILNIASAVGLYLVRKWGFIVTYIAIIFSTIFFSTSYVPFISTFFPVHVRYVALIAINLAVLSYVFYLDVLFRKKSNV
ncbi:MAG: hypothetical protein A3F12_07640 [Gammaproteobacteria bacterium RIFCSPHIGHO2_12_FULL_38_14]|nr:MAG: hypothetical protein A3F12_07640 [Gammaproteobacteria bacterium RIFCSPHIGHO2_12_FULL_38_14]